MDHGKDYYAIALCTVDHAVRTFNDLSNVRPFVFRNDLCRFRKQANLF